MALELALCAVGVGLVVAGCGSSSSGKTLTLGYVTGPTHPYGLALQTFADDVKTASNGQLTIKLLPTYGGGSDATLLAPRARRKRRHGLGVGIDQGHGRRQTRLRRSKCRS